MFSVFGLLLLGQPPVMPVAPPTVAIHAQTTPSGTNRLPRYARIDPNEKEWKPTPISPMKLARKADLSLNTESRRSALWQAMMFLPEGNGRATGKWAILSPSAWKLETIDLSLGPKELSSRSYIANGKEWTFSKKGVWSKPKSLSGWRSQSRSVSTAKWTTLFPLAIAEAVGSKRPVFSQLIQDATKSGAKFKSQVRTVKVAGGASITSFRIVGTGSKIGPQLVEVVFESLNGLPVTIRTQSGSNKKQSNLVMTFRWQFDRSQGFNPKDFVLPTNSGPIRQ